MNKNLAIIILTWNDFENTIKCIKSAVNSLRKNDKIFIIDNHSKKIILDKTISWISKNYYKKFQNKIYEKPVLFPVNIIKNKSIFLIRNKKNLGCGYGHNTGYKIAIINNFEFVARVDNDMILTKNFFEKIMVNFKNKKVEGISPKIMYTKRPKFIWWMGTKIGNSLKYDVPMRDYPYNLLDDKKYRGIIKTEAIAGCASIMRTSRLRKIGLSDKDFFYGPEDIEFSKRIFTIKGSLIVDRNIKIYHSVTQSFVNLNKRKIYYEYKYRLLLIKKIGSFMDKFVGYTWSFVKFLLYVIFSFKKKHRYKLEPVFLAWRDFILNRFGEYDRKTKTPF